MERTIKKYQNRKLYDVKESKYVTLTELAQFLAAGDTLAVVDNVTGADLTPIVLTEILLEVEKDNQGNIPVTVLQEIIKSGEGSIYKFLQKFALGSIESNLDRAGELRDYLAKMVQAGELTEDQGKHLSAILNQNMEKATSLEKILDVEETLDKALNKVKHIYQLQKDIQKLRSRVIHLENEVAQRKR